MRNLDDVVGDGCAHHFLNRGHARSDLTLAVFAHGAHAGLTGLATQVDEVRTCVNHFLNFFRNNEEFEDPTTALVTAFPTLGTTGALHGGRPSDVLLGHADGVEFLGGRLVRLCARLADAPHEALGQGPAQSGGH